jgi:hypothetical protein
VNRAPSLRRPGRSSCCRLTIPSRREAIFASTRGYQHFQFSDYSKLTVIGWSSPARRGPW